MKFSRRKIVKFSWLLNPYSICKLGLHLGLALTLPVVNFTVQGLFVPIHAQALSNLSISTITSTPNVSAGGAATYTIRVANPTTSTISNVSITDNLPTGFTFDAMIGVPSLSNSATQTTVVNPTPNSSNPNWGNFTLPPSASVSVTFTANIPSTQTLATYQNPVAVTYTNVSGNQTETYNHTSSTLEDVTISAAPPLPPAAPPPPIRSSAGICAAPGKDGAGNLSGIVNTYYQGTSTSANINDKSIDLVTVAGVDTTINAGDLLLVIQMQDATIDTTNTAAYGSGITANDGSGQTDMGRTGQYEYVVATNSVSSSGGRLTFEGTGTNGGLRYTYSNSAATSTTGQRRFQVIRVPQYSNLTLTNTLSPVPWNGQFGGILAIDVAGQLNFNDRTIEAAGRGFRGGYAEVRASGNSVLTYVATTSTTGAGKGEGTAGTPQFVWNGITAVDNGSQGYPNGDYGRGAPANAGGGGNIHNAGGGGGGNGGIGGKGGIPWEGAGGAVDSGGRGGALSSLTSIVPTRLFFGGGGGGGDANNASTGVRGGVGGGLIAIRAGTSRRPG